jgi:hypothetical protein
MNTFKFLVKYLQFKALQPSFKATQTYQKFNVDRVLAAIDQPKIR